MTTFNPADYWPQFFNKEPGLAHFVYPAVGALPGYASTFFYDPAMKAMKLCQYDLDNNWMSNWYLQKQTAGLFEVQDETPQTNSLLAALFGPQLIERYSTPIGWGGPAVSFIGSPRQYSNSPSFAPFSCRPPQFGSGLQVVLFEDLLDTWSDAQGRIWNNVLQMFYQQSWGNGAPTGARWMMPKGVGPVAAQWVSGSTVEPWQTAAYTKV